MGSYIPESWNPDKDRLDNIDRRLSHQGLTVDSIERRLEAIEHANRNLFLLYEKILKLLKEKNEKQWCGDPFR